MMEEQLLTAIQRIALNAVNSGSPCDYCIGTVMSVDPLTIQIDQQEEALTEDFLVLTDLVRDFQVDITVSHKTENRSGGSGDAAYASHNHAYSGRKKITVHNGLSVGESVILLRQAGGQEFLVLSRVNDHQNLTGEWL